MRSLLLGLALALLAPVPSSATRTHLDVEELERRLTAAAGLEDSLAREAQLDSLWARLREGGDFPFVDGERVVFLYRGDATDLKVVGDFNGWRTSGPSAPRLAGTSVWIQRARYPRDARLDYKFVRNGHEWLLDPENPRRQRGGFGENSVLAMPDHEPSPWVVRDESVPRGTLSDPLVVESTHLGYAVSSRVYVPASAAQDLPAIYVTDGHEYAQDDMGSMVIVLDNLIAAGRIPPVLAVFVDPRRGGQNLREQQYVMSEAFVDFVTKELVPTVDGRFLTDARREARAILGTSLGGLNSAWFALRAPQTFGLVAMQSPAFQAGGGTIVDLYRAAPRQDVRMHMSWGTFHDFGETTLQMVEVLQAKGYDLATVVTHEGHSWGQWRALLDDVLTHFWGLEGETQ